MKRLRPGAFLTGAAVALGAAVLSAFFFVAFIAPGRPRTAWGWLISAALGLPVLVVGSAVFALASEVVRGDRGIPSVLPRLGMPPRVRRLDPGLRLLVGAARVLFILLACGVLLWGLHLLLGIEILRRQFS